MKRILKSCLVVLVAVCVAFPLVACKKKVSPTTTNVENVKVVNGVSTNGGLTVVHGEYLYFINGVKTNDGSKLKDNKRSAICRVKYDVNTGETSGDMEIVVDELVGFKYGTLHVFGDYLYYTTPCMDKNSNATVLYNKTSFKRYDLVNKKSYTIFTTALNNSSETVEYAYYVSGESLNLLVYEKTNATITSIKVDSKPSTNYVISEVLDCVLSETYGKPQTSAAVDASSFVFYSKSPEEHDAQQSGSRIFKTSPVQDNSSLLSKGADITLLSIRAGKLMYTYDSVVCAQKITEKTDDTLPLDKTNCVSRSDVKAIYIENYKLEGQNETAKLVKSEGDITVLAFSEFKDAKAYYFSLFQWTDVNKPINHTNIDCLSSATDFEFIGLTTIEEVTVEKDEDKGIEEEKGKFLYAIYKESNKVYKVQVASIEGDNTDSMKVSAYAENGRLQLSGSTLTATTGTLLPESIGNFLFILAENDDKKNSYLIKVDLSVTKTNSDKSEAFGIVEEPKTTETDKKTEEKK